MQMIKTTAGNTGGSGIRAEREGTSFTLITGGHLVYSWVSCEASRSGCCHLLATLKICGMFIGLKTKPSFVAFLLFVLSRTYRILRRILMTEASLAFPHRAPLAVMAQPSVPAVFQRDGAS